MYKYKRMFAAFVLILMMFAMVDYYIKSSHHNTFHCQLHNCSTCNEIKIIRESFNGISFSQNVGEVFFTAFVIFVILVKKVEPVHHTLISFKVRLND